jgi:molybdopterin-guanine dinucleotide biosynthesis protein A
MRSNKALLPVEGVPLWRRQVQVLHRAGANTVYVSLATRQHWVPDDVPTLLDPIENVGPISGLVAALRAGESCGASHVALLAVDLPHLPSSWFVELRALCTAAQGAVGKWLDGRFEPLAAIYPLTLRALAESRVQVQQYSLQSLSAEACREGLLVSRWIAEVERPLFTNWNSPADVKAPPESV